MEEIDLFEEMENSLLEQQGFVRSLSGVFLKGDDYFYRSKVFPRVWVSHFCTVYITFEEILNYLKEKL